MYFVLNKRIKFNPDINELSLINETQSSIVLSKSASRLLLTLIHNVNVVTSREYFLKNVWEDYGYTPSNNNLYMAISELRKAFMSLWSDKEFIVTVPKVGLKLEAEIDVLEKSIDGTTLEIEIEDKKKKEEIKSSLAKLESLNKGKIKEKLKIAITLIILFSFLTFIILKFKFPMSVNESIDELAFKYGTCDVYSYTISAGQANNDIIFREDVINKLVKYKVLCDNVKRNVYVQTYLKHPGAEKSYFIGVCTYILNSNKRKCETINEVAE